MFPPRFDTTREERRLRGRTFADMGEMAEAVGETRTREEGKLPADNGRLDPP